MTENAVETATVITMGPERSLVPVQDEATGIVMAVISAVTDPTVDLTRIDALYEFMRKVKYKPIFEAALARASGQFKTPKKLGIMEVYSKAHRKYAAENDGEYPPGAKPIQSTPYARIEDLVEAAVPALSAEGLHISYEPQEFFKDVSDGQGRTIQSLYYTVTGIMTGHGYEKRVTSLSMPMDSSGSKNTAQAIKSTYSYGRKMVFEALTGIVARGDDDDGKATGAIIADLDDAAEKGPSDYITDAQLKTLNDLLDKLGRPEKLIEQICTVYAIRNLSQLPPARYDECHTKLANRVKTQEKNAP